MPMRESRIRADNEAIPERGPDIECDVLPWIRHLPRCGLNLALELWSNFQTAQSKDMKTQPS